MKRTPLETPSLLVTLSAALLLSCATTPRQASSGSGSFPELRDSFFAEYLERSPVSAVSLGFHEYDGKVPDYSAESLREHEAWLEASREKLAGPDPASLSSIERVEREVLLQSIKSELFSLQVQRDPWRNPMAYSWPLSIDHYISRDYAPVERRVEGLISVAEQAPDYLATARENLEAEMPRTWVETALMQTRGAASFARDDVRAALEGAALEPELRQRLDAALETLASALERHAAWLDERLADSTDDYRLGTDRFLAMLDAVNGVEIDLEELRAVAEADLAKNLARIQEAAREIDAERSTAEVVAQVLSDKPAADGVLATAEEQLKRLRAYVLANDVVTVPSEERATVVETPPFLRYNFAFLDGAGPFEEKELESFYYITPPDPSWPKEQQEGYLPGKTDLLGTSIHEVWPGHFLHKLHQARLESDVLKSFWNYATGEGWAHYTEEMMVWDAGYRKDEPEVRIGMLINALLRDVRFLSAIGLHAGDMTVEASERLFREKAFQDPANARQQAVRGTFDPMYLSYTLGKLMILQLRGDWKAKVGEDAYSLKAFHDAFLSYGAAPVPVIREAMLGPDAGPALQAHGQAAGDRGE